MRGKVDTPGYWIRDAFLHLRHAADLIAKPEETTFGTLKATAFVIWQAMKIAEDLGADTLKPLADYIPEETCFIS